MPVFKPRNRLVNFRLSEEEFDKLRASCSLYGARSLSDFARAAVMRSVAHGLPAGEYGATDYPRDEGSLGNLNQKVTELESQLAQLLRLVDAIRPESSPHSGNPLEAMRAGEQVA